MEIRRLVKRMMFDRKFTFIASLFGVQGSSSSAEAPVPEKGALRELKQINDLQ